MKYKELLLTIGYWNLFVCTLFSIKIVYLILSMII